MGKLDSMIKCAQARNLLEEKQFQKAIDLVEPLDIEKVKSIIDLKTIAQVYIECKRFLDAREVYLLIYEKIKSRSVLYHLVYLSVKCGQVKEAEAYFAKFKEIGGEDVDVLILAYYIEKAKGSNHLEQIESVQKILHVEYLEEWAYELAKLYHKEGFEAECVAECEKIVLWFGEGIIVEKAMLLKLHYVEGIDISSPKAIGETRNISADLKIAAEIAKRQEENHNTEQEEVYEEQQEDLEEYQLEPQQGIEMEVSIEEKKQQMIQSIVAEAQKSKQMPHFLLIGNEDEKIMSIIKPLAKNLCEGGVLKTSKIARISAEKLNEIDLEERKEQIDGTCLLIERANQLSLDSMQNICQLMRRARVQVVIGFVDEEAEMQKLLLRNRKIKTLIKYELYV
ncbi:MAG: hypothetical protein PWP24_1869 [Clostridiales bacterium]|nr:hypothetical protein [Clostridiales bacterium]